MIRQALILSILLLFTLNVIGQISITGYSFSGIGINTNDNKKLYAELKIFSNRQFDDLIIELDGYYNFKERKYHQLSIGLGLNIHTGFIDVPNAVTLPISIQIHPIKEYQNLSVIYELSPEYYMSDVFNLRHLWGVRFMLSKE